MTSEYPCHLTGTARAPCGNLAIALRGGGLKSCVLPTIAVRPACGDRRAIMRCSYDVSMGYGLMIFKFLYNSELYKIVEATVTLQRETV